MVVVLRLLGLLCCVAAAATAYYWPTYGFAAVTAFTTLFVTYILEYKRLQAERPYYYKSAASLLGGALFLRPFAGISTIGRGLAAGAAAIFTFPAKGAFENLSKATRETPISQYAEQMSLDYGFTLWLIVCWISFGVFVALFLDLFTAGRGHRWSLFRTTFLVGVLYSASVHFIQQENVSAGEGVMVFAPPKPDLIRAILLPTQINYKTQLCGTVKEYGEGYPDNGIRPPKEPSIFTWNPIERYKRIEKLETWRTNRCGSYLTPKYCASMKRPDGTFKDEWFGLVSGTRNWQKFGCEPPDELRDAELARALVEEANYEQLLALASVLDDFVRTNLILFAERILGSDTSSGSFFTLLVAILVSSDLLQGIVLSVYITLIVLVISKRKVGPYRE